MILPLPWVPTRPGLRGFLITSGKLVWGILACRMCADSMGAEAARKARLPQQAQLCGTGVEGDRRAACFLCLSHSSQSLPKPLHPFHSLDKDLYAWQAALHWVTSSLLRSLLCQDSQDFQGAGVQEGVGLGKCWGVCAPNSRVLFHGPAPAWPIAAHLCMSLSPWAVLGRVRPHLRESPLLSPPRSFSPFPTSLGRDGRATLPVLSGSLLPPSDHRGGTPQLVHSLGPVCFYMNNHPVCASQRTKNH